MSTTKTRVNISFSKEDERFLAVLAKRDPMPVATKARQLVQAVMELEEDYHLARIAEQRDL